MEIKDIANLFITAIGKVEFYWNFYTVTLLAIIGWLVTTKKTLRVGLKLFISIGYLVFVLMNIIGLYSSYAFAEALQKDLLIAAEQSATNSLSNTYAVLAGISYSNQKILTLLIHAVLGIFILCVIWFGRFGESESNIN